MGLRRLLAAPLTRYLDRRFDRIERKVARTNRAIHSLRESVAGSVDTPATVPPEVALCLRQHDALSRVDVREHNARGEPPTFDRLVSQSADAGQMDKPSFRALAVELEGDSSLLPEHPAVRADSYHRKAWEYTYIAAAIRQSGNLKPGRRAIGFGVGTEPLPAFLASRGLQVVATDQGIEGSTGSDWAATGQLMKGLRGLSRPHLISPEDLARQVTIREVDMNHIPPDIGRCDVTWSSCVIEHLGSPAAGMDFVIESCRLLNPGGVAVHTTELELLPQAETRDYGHCAVYRIADLMELNDRLAEVGCVSEFNYYVGMDRPEDRWVSMLAQPDGDLLPDPEPGVHLKLLLGESVTTSFGIFITKLG